MMPEIFSRSPITEAVIDLQIAPPESLAVADLLAAELALQERYTFIDDIRTIQTTVQMEPKPSAVDFKSDIVGYRYASHDKQWLVQFRLNGFTLSALSPYPGWEMFRNEARDLWEIYKGIAKPTAVVRVATRFINQIALPDADLGKHLVVFPAVGPGIPFRNPSSFFLQIQIPQPDLDCMLILNQARVPDPQPDQFVILLDFDLFRDVRWPLENEAEIWDLLEKFRDRKNELFRASITDQTRELLQ